jgi:CMP-N-acetylneuraminic acid synthetase
MRWICLMPLRGGSKSIPLKNLLDIAGRPLFSWSLEQAILSGCFDEIIVASDHENIRERVRREFGEAIAVIDRTPESATDEATTESIMLEVASHTAFDVMCLVQATSPFTRAHHFKHARAEFIHQDLDSMLSAVISKRFYWSLDGKPLNYDPSARPRRQDFPGTLIENGAFYFTRAHILFEQRCRLGGKIGVFEMPEESLLEIDEPEDIEAARRILMRRASSEDPVSG